MISGKLDWMLDEPSTDLLPEIRAKYQGDRYEENTANSTYYMFMNTQTPPFDKLKVRQAVNYGFDKRAAVRLFGGLLTPDCNFLPPGMVGYTKIDPCPWGDPNAAPDLEKARSLIKEAGAEGAKVTVWGDDEERSKKITEYYTDVLNKIGLKATPRIIGAETYFATIGDRKLNAQTGFDDWFQDFPHPADFFFLNESGSIQPTNNQNHSLIDDPKVDKLAQEIKQETAEDGADKSAELDKYLTGPEKRVHPALRPHEGHHVRLRTDGLQELHGVSPRVSRRLVTVLPQVGMLVIGPPRPRAGAVGHATPNG